MKLAIPTPTPTLTARSDHSALSLASWAAPLMERHRYKVLYGGRASGKTWQVAGALILLGARRPLRIVCAREFQASIKESAKRTLEIWIDRLGWRGSKYHVQRDYIIGDNGTLIFFHGMSTSTEESIRGWEGVDVVWVEEAHMMSERSREILYPTIRKPGSELWFTFNPHSRADPVWRDFVSAPRPGAWTRKVNFYDNPWCPEEAHQERRICLAMEPERYPHVWLGEPDDGGMERKVLPYGLLRQCVDRWDPAYAEGFVSAGLDVADRGPDYNALVFRQGPCVLSAERWHTDDIGVTVSRTIRRARSMECRMLYYDAGGVGGALRGLWPGSDARRWAVEGINFGSSPAGPDARFDRRHTQKDLFMNRASQMAWTLRLRAIATQQGEPPERCLFIDPAIPRLEDFLAELSRPEWRESAGGRLQIVKMKDDEQSPDRYDALALAFASDSRRGIAAFVGPRDRPSV